MTDTSSLSVCVVDFGQFTSVAEVLARHFGKTYLFVPWESSFPTRKEMVLGTGLRGVTKVERFWDIAESVDLFVFPDVWHGGLQEHLASIGKRVWGSRGGARLELDREYGKEAMAERGLDVGPWRPIVGMKRLRDYLRNHDDVFVKVSEARGVCESFRSESYGLVEPHLDEIEYKLGPEKNDLRFVVEDAIPGAVELALDEFSIDGQFPETATLGLEVKDQCYLGCAVPRKRLPENLVAIDAGVAPLLAKAMYRNFWACEARITKGGTAYVLDPCCRMGSPSGEALLAQVENLGNLMWHGAEGDLVEPEITEPWSATALITSKRRPGDFSPGWEVLEISERVREHVFVRFPAALHGKTYVYVGGEHGAVLGAVAATGKTRAQAVKKVQDLASEVGGYYVATEAEALDQAVKEWDDLEKFGVDVPHGTS